MRAHVDRSHDIIHRALRRQRCYVAISGGKDSMVLDDLLDEHRRDGSTIVRIHSDDELMLPEHLDTIDAMLQRDPDMRLVTADSATVHAGWHRPWRERPYWRPWHPSLEHTGGTIRQWAKREGFEAVFLGRRRAESQRRARIMASGPRRTRQGVIEIDPLIDWSDDQVWEHISDRKLAYCVAYDVQFEAGISRHSARLGPIPLMPDHVLRAGWPVLFDELGERYGHWGAGGGRNTYGGYLIRVRRETGPASRTAPSVSVAALTVGDIVNVEKTRRRYIATLTDGSRREWKNYPAAAVLEWLERQKGGESVHRDQ